MTEQTEEIKVIVESGAVNIDALSREERAIIWSRMADQVKEVPRYYFLSLQELYENELELANLRAKPDIVELLVRQIIYMSTRVSVVSVGSPTRQLIVPIIISPFRQNIANIRKQSAETQQAQSIKIRMDFPVKTITADGMNYIAAKNEEITVVGLKCLKFCHGAPTRKLFERIITGSATPPEISSNCKIFHLAKYDNWLEFTNIMITDSNKDLDVLFHNLYNLMIYIRKLSAVSVYEHIREGIPRIDIFKDTAPVSAPVPAYMPKSAFLKELEKITGISFDHVFTSNLYILLQLCNLLDVWFYNNIDVLNIYQAQRTRRDFLRENEQKRAHNLYEISTYLMLISARLDSHRIDEINTAIRIKPIMGASVKNLLSLLTQPERRIIELEYTKRAKYIESAISNKCDHIQKYRRLRRATTLDQIGRGLAALKPFVVAAAAGGKMIKCAKCDFDLICPHLLELLEAEVAKASFADIKVRLTKYIDNVPVRYQYFCKICGEVISSSEIIGDIYEPEHDITINEDLRTMIWNEITHLMRYMHFSSLINVSQLLTSIRDYIYPFIYEIDKQITKSRTGSADENKAKRRLYITIYGFAYLIHLVDSNAKAAKTSKVSKASKSHIEIKFRDPKASKDSKDSLINMIKYCLDEIILSRNIIIKEIPGMTNDIIKNQLIAAYKLISTGGKAIINISGEVDNILTSLVLDPIFIYLFRMKITDIMLNGKKPGYIDAITPAAIDQVIGKNLHEVAKKHTEIYVDVHPPHIDQRWHLRNFEELRDFAWANDKDLPNAERGFIGASFKLFWEYLHSGIFRKQLFESGGKIARVYAEIRDKWRDLGAIADKLRKWHGAHFLKPYSSLGAIQGRGAINPLRYNPTDLGGLGRIYDEDGNAHKWNIIIMGNITDMNINAEFKIPDLAKKVAEDKNPLNIVETDRKCGVCGVLESATTALDSTKILEALDAKYAIGNFFRFYENRCPKGGLHMFEGANGDKCTKCGFVQSMAITVDKSALAYFKANQQAYIAESKEFASESIIDLRAGILPFAPANYSKEYENWAFNFNLIVELSNKLKLNQRLLMAIGAMERVEYTDILNGSYVPPEVQSRSDARIFVIDNYVVNLIAEYNLLRYISGNMKPSADIAAIIDKSGIDKHKLAELPEILPVIGAERYNEVKEWFRLNKKPRETVDFYLQNFCEMCLRIYNDTNAATERMRIAFVDYIVKKTLKCEIMVTKYGYFNWAILYGDKESKVSEYDANVSKDEEESREEVEEGEDVGNTAAPFSTDDLDIDVDPESDSEDANNVRVGDDYGL